MSPRLPGAANTCGATFDASAFNVDAATATITVNAVNDDALDITVNTTGAVDAEYTTGQPTIYVLWNDIIVGAAPITFEGWTWDSVAGETTSAPHTPPLVNCWDDAAIARRRLHDRFRARHLHGDHCAARERGAVSHYIAGTLSVREPGCHGVERRRFERHRGRRYDHDRLRSSRLHYRRRRCEGSLRQVPQHARP